MKLKNILASALALTLCVSSAAALADDGSVIEIDGKKYVVAQDAWDIDFDGEHVGSHRWGAPYVEVKNSLTSSTLTNSLGNALTMHTGTTVNTITSEDSGDEEHGDALKFVANDNAQVQINEGAATASGDFLVYEWDFKLSKLPDSTGATINVMQPVLAGGKWLNNLAVTADGSLIEFSFNSKKMPAVLDKWHKIKCHVNFIDMKYSFSVDGEVLDAMSLPSGVQNKGQKVVAMLANAKGGIMWIDNIRHYSLNAVPDIVGISTEGNFIDIEMSKAISTTDFTKEEILANTSVKYNGKEIELADVEETSNAKVTRFKAIEPIPTAVPLDIVINYMGIEIAGTFESTPAAVDMKNVVIEKSGSTITAKATGHNDSGEDRFAVMVLVLYDANGRVAAITYSPKSPIVTDIDVSVSATSAKAEYAKVFFMNDWDNPTPFKNMYYMMESE